jgi:methyl-accepting chemotaxis protein
MRLHKILILTHVLVALAGGLAAGLADGIGDSAVVTCIAASGLAGILALVVGYLQANCILNGIDAMERAISAGDGTHVRETGIREIDEANRKFCLTMQRWAEAAANSREQSREVDRLLQQLDRRDGRSRTRGKGSGQSLRKQLNSISAAAAAELKQLVACTREIERCTREISQGAEDQSDAVSKTTTYVEQMSTNIDSVARNAGAAQQAAVSTRDSAAAALTLVHDLIAGMNRIRTHVEASESRLRSLGDHSHEIGSIVETIGSISSRTDMLALNASIESVRAGEHGRGFAVVAEEVRKLAEQAAQATREVAGLIDSIQLQTRESIALMAEERAEVESEVRRVSEASNALDRISRISTDSAAQVAEITNAAQLQLQLTQDVVLAVERISNVARASRARAEEACWTTSTLTKLAQRCDDSLAPLRGSDRGKNDDGHDPTTDAVHEGPVHVISDETNSPADMWAAMPSA